MTYYLLQCFWNLLSHIPLRVMYVLSDALFYPMYYLVGYRRKVVRKNLTESFPEKSLREILRIEKQFYKFFIDLIFETCKLASMSQSEIGRRMKFTNPEVLETLSQKGKSITLYLGHYGNWEWISSLSLYVDKEIMGGQIYRKLSNKTVNRLLIHNRERFGTICIEMKETPRRINEFVNNKKLSIIGYLADQSPKKRNIRHYVPFLHHHTPVLVGVEKITKRYGFEAVYINVKRMKRGYYEATFVQLHENPKSLPDFELTNLYYRHLEQSILEQPELYLWTHNRFKHVQKNV